MLEDGVGDVGDFGARGGGIGDHAFEQVRRDDDRLDRGKAEVDRAPLDDRQLLVGHLDAEVAPRDHQPVAGGDDFLQILHRHLVLDLRDDADVAVLFRIFERSN